MAAVTELKLTSNDKNVLSALFDAECKPNPVSEPEDTEPQLPDPRDQRRRQREIEIIRTLDSDSPAESDIKVAISQLTDLITEDTGNASAYNNRAQAIKLLLGDDLFSPVVSTSTLFSDLNTAISLASSQPNASRVLASAYTHRAHLLYKASRKLASNQGDCISSSLPSSLKDMDSQSLERLAARDFEMGGKFGSEIARQMAVRLNPMAKLCGEIVREAMVRDMKESGVLPP